LLFRGEKGKEGTMPQSKTFLYTVHKFENGVRTGFVAAHDSPKLIYAEDECDAKVRVTAKLAKAGEFDPDDPAKKVEVEILYPLAK